MPQHALAIRFEHQHRIAITATDHAGRMLNRYRFVGQNCRKPDVKARSHPGGAPYLNGPAMLLNDLAGCRKSKPVALRARREERLENPLQRRLVHTAPRIGNRDDRETTRTDAATPHSQMLCYLSHINPNIDVTLSIHCLSGIVA